LSKRKETLELESALALETKTKRIYGCEEITIGFYNNGHGNEIVDFMTMDSKGTIKCYELKVTLQDLKSDAKKSWYGHYNYLVVSEELYDGVDTSDWNLYIPGHIGIIVGYPRKDETRWLESKRKAKKCEVSDDTGVMLKESMIRSVFYKMEKYKDTQSIEKYKRLNSEIRKLSQERDKYYEKSVKAENLIYKFEKYKSHNDGTDVKLQELADAEYQKYKMLRNSILTYNI
jgi:hypothetical protein